MGHFCGALEVELQAIEGKTKFEIESKQKAILERWLDDEGQSAEAHREELEELAKPAAPSARQKAQRARARAARRR